MSIGLDAWVLVVDSEREASGYSVFSGYQYAKVFLYKSQSNEKVDIFDFPKFIPITVHMFVKGRNKKSILGIVYFEKEFAEEECKRHNDLLREASTKFKFEFSEDIAKGLKELYVMPLSELINFTKSWV